MRHFIWLKKIVCTSGVCFFWNFQEYGQYRKKINSRNWWTICSLVTYTVQLNLSLHVYFISDKIVLKCVKTHDSRISKENHISYRIFLIYTEKFNAKFWVVLKILRVINSLKYVGITKNYLCIHRVLKAPWWSRAGYDVSVFKRIRGSIPLSIVVGFCALTDALTFPKAQRGVIPFFFFAYVIIRSYHFVEIV